MFSSFVLNLLSFIVCFVVVLSLTGKSLGVRRYLVKLLISILQWISEQQYEQERFDEIEERKSRDEIEEVGSGDLEPKEQHLSEFERLRRRRASGLVNRKWTASINKKLSAAIEDSQMQEENIANVLIDPSLEFLSAGVEAIVEDEVTSRFSAAQLASWNLLSRSRTYVRLNWKVTIVFAVGVAIRYLILLPIRFTLFTVASLFLLIGSLIIGCIPNERIRRMINKHFMKCFMRIMSTAFSSIIYFHDRKNRPKHGIVVANHTSPIDALILGTDNCYSMIGQRHGGVLGFMQNAIGRCAHHIWFERSESRDRNSVADVVYPIALKYDNRLGDAFWNSSEQSIFTYILSIMTSWALIADVWYLPAVRRKSDEDPVDFAKRVKRLIAKKGGLIDLDWDGNLKRTKVPDRLKDAQKERFFNYLLRTQTLLDIARSDTTKGLKNIKSMPNMDKINNAPLFTGY